MKKLLLLVLTVVMLMCVAVFGINAVDECAPGEHSIDLKNNVRICTICGKTNWCAAGKHTETKKTVEPTCTNRGYDVRYCADCGEDFSRFNYVPALGHLWANRYVAATDSQGDYYKNERTCTREGCGVTEVETKVVDDKTVNVRYYLVQFFNAKVTGGYLETFTLDSGKVIDIKHAKLADQAKFKTVPLCKSDIYVRENGSYTYDGELPRRGKDVDAGGYAFVGWTSDVLRDTDKEPDVPTVDPNNPSVNNYEITIKNINRNYTYFACWKSIDATYSVQFMNSNGESWIAPNNGQMQIPHGGKINYIWVYPQRKPTVSTDFVFTGWGCGDPKKKDADGKYTQYDEYMLADNIHISEIPIFSNDAFIAIHAPQARVYKVQFDLNKDPAENKNAIIANVGFGEALKLDKDNKLLLDQASIYNYDKLNESDFIIKDEYRDNTYIYQFENSYITNTGHEIKSNSFSVPQYTLDADDVVYLECYEKDATEYKLFGVGDKKIVFDDSIEHTPFELKLNKDEKLSRDNFDRGLDPAIHDFFDYFKAELDYYNFCMDVNNKTVYKGKYFDLSKDRYYFPISEHGDYVYDASKNKIWLEVSFKGIYKIDTNGAREEFTREDAKELRLVKVEPEYRSIVRLYPFTVEVVFPIELNGKEVELLPEDYLNTLVVQVKNENAHILAKGYTGTKVNGKTFDIVTDKNGNKYYHVYCQFAVQKAERYEISVASIDEKYEGKKTLYWSVYTTMYDNVNNQMKSNIIVDASIRDGYNQSVNCYCLCHGPLKGLWVRILNILYSLFKVKYECCPHMHAELGDLLAY